MKNIHSLAKTWSTADAAFSLRGYVNEQPCEALA